MPRSRELAAKRAALLARGERQRSRLYQQAEVLRTAGARIDRVLQMIPAAASPPIIVGAGALLVLALGRQRSLRLAAGALGAWATVQRIRQLGASMALFSKRSG